jgi:hypothetical protein
MATNEGIEFPKLIDEEEVDWTTRPTPLHELPAAERMGMALGVLESQHKRIFTAITTIWGHKECSRYMQGLIMNGGEGTGRDRIGFKPEVLSALMTLDLLHDQQFGRQ